MAYNFFEFDRDQSFLLPQNMIDWLPKGDLAHFVIEVVDKLDLTEFLSRYRTDGRGAAAYHPRMMVALLLYAYCVGERSSRRIEKLCSRDVGFRVISGNLVPDYSTIARFRKDNEDAISLLFGQVLALCARAGVVKPSFIAIDGTKLKASASLESNKTYASLSNELEKLAGHIIEEANQVDEEEDRLYGPDNNPYGCEMPEQLRDDEKRKAWIEEKLEEMKRQAEDVADKQQKKVEAYREKREVGIRRLGREPYSPQVARDRFLARRKVNTTDPESHIIKSPKGYIQGFNGQLAVTENQVIVAVDLTNTPDDWKLLHPMVGLSEENLREAGIDEPIESVAADAGYGSRENLNEAERLGRESIEKGDTRYPDFFVATKKAWVIAAEMAQAAASKNSGKVPFEDSDPGVTAVERMERKLLSRAGRETYAKRGKTIEPVFGQMKDSRRLERFMRRGLESCKSEWNLMATTHNILKLWRSGQPLAETG